VSNKENLGLNLNKEKNFQIYIWKILYGNINLQLSTTNDMYYIIPMAKKNEIVDVNWDIIEDLNNLMINLNDENNNITLGDWLSYAKYFLQNPENTVEFEGKYDAFEKIAII